MALNVLFIHWRVWLYFFETGNAKIADNNSYHSLKVTSISTKKVVSFKFPRKMFLKRKLTLKGCLSFSVVQYDLEAFTWKFSWLKELYGEFILPFFMALIKLGLSQKIHTFVTKFIMSIVYCNLSVSFFGFNFISCLELVMLGNVLLLTPLDFWHSLQGLEITQIFEIWDDIWKACWVF